MQIPHPQVPGYSVVDLVGRGGFGVVYRAVQQTVDRDVAIKVDSRVVLNEADRRRFLRETKAAGRLSGHPHVVDLYDAGILSDGRPYLVMELCAGGSLLDRLSHAGALPPGEVCEVGVQIADALAAAHSAGMLHRDIKPANILINQYGMYGLADFGLVALAEPGRESSATLTALTPAYAAPEAFRQEPPTERCDIYSLGATLYAMLAGRPPRYPRLGEPSLAQLIRLHDKPVPAVAGVPDELMTVLFTALSTDPAARYASAVELRDTLAGLDIESGNPDTPASGAPQATAREDAETTLLPVVATGSKHTTGAVAAATRVEDGPGPTVSFGFGPRRDEVADDQVLAPDPPTTGLLDEAPQPSAESDCPAQPPRHHTKRLLGRAGRVTAVLAAVTMLVLAGVAWALISRFQDAVGTSDVLDVAGSPEETDGATDILLVGSDSRTDFEGRPLPDDVLKLLRTEHTDGVSTDTLILARLPDDGSDAVLVSIPRDAKVQIPGAGSGTISDVFGIGKQRAETELRAGGVTDRGRIAQESDEAGRRLLVRVVQELTGARIDRYAELNLYGFYLISEAIGGVEVCLKRAVTDPDSGADFEAGRQVISKGDALAFVRQRQGLPRGDLDRIVRQQAFLAAMVDKLLASGTLTDPAVLSDLATTLRRTMIIDSDWEILDFAQRMREMTAGDIEFVTVPVRGGNGGSGQGTGTVLVDPVQVRSFVAGLVDGSPAASPSSGESGARGSPPVREPRPRTGQRPETRTAHNAPITADGITCVN